MFWKETDKIYKSFRPFITKVQLWLMVALQILHHKKKRSLILTMKKTFLIWILTHHQNLNQMMRKLSKTMMLLSDARWTTMTGAEPFLNDFVQHLPFLVLSIHYFLSIVKIYKHEEIQKLVKIKIDKIKLEQIKFWSLLEIFSWWWRSLQFTGLDYQILSSLKTIERWVT